MHMLWKFKMYIKTLSLQQHQFSVRWELACFLLTTKWCIFKQIKFLKCYFKNKYLQILLFLPPPPLVTFHLSRFRENNLPTNGRKWLLYCLLLECWIVNVCSVGWGGGEYSRQTMHIQIKEKRSLHRGLVAFFPLI